MDWPARGALTGRRGSTTCSPETRIGCSSCSTPSDASARVMTSWTPANASPTLHAPSARGCGTTSRPASIVSARTLSAAEGELPIRAGPHDPVCLLKGLEPVCWRHCISIARMHDARSCSSCTLSSLVCNSSSSFGCKPSTWCSSALPVADSKEVHWVQPCSIRSSRWIGSSLPPAAHIISFSSWPTGARMCDSSSSTISTARPVVALAAASASCACQSRFTPLSGRR